MQPTFEASILITLAWAVSMGCIIAASLQTNQFD